MNETLEQMEVQLSHLAMRWRSRKNTPEAEAIVTRYQALLRQMIEMGFRSELYTDSELPDRLMPQEYLDLFEK